MDAESFRDFEKFVLSLTHSAVHIVCYYDPAGKMGKLQVNTSNLNSMAHSFYYTRIGISDIYKIATLANLAITRPLFFWSGDNNNLDFQVNALAASLFVTSKLRIRHDFETIRRMSLEIQYSKSLIHIIQIIENYLDMANKVTDRLMRQ